MRVICIAMVGVALLLLTGCDSPTDLFKRVVTTQVDRIRNLEQGRIPCMHCPWYFRFEADQSLIAEIIRDHGLGRTESPPEEMSSLLAMIDATWWIRGKAFDESEKYFAAYDPPKGAQGERRIRIALVRNGTMYFVTNGYRVHDKPTKGEPTRAQ